MFDLRDKVTALAVAMILAAIAFGSGYHYGAKHQNAEGAQTIVSALAANETLKRNLEAKTNEANAALDVLLNTPAPRVRVPTTCPNNPVIPASISSVPAAGPQRASNPAQDAFDVARGGMESDAAEWSRAMNQCIELQAWANQIARPAK